MNRHSHNHEASLDAWSAHCQVHADLEPLGPDCIDGTQEGLRRFLAEMAQLSGAGGEVLTLQLEDIVASAMLAAEGGLTIAAQMPRSVSPGMRKMAPAGCELAWHAELGCEVLVRHLPLAALRSEPDVLDAIMDTADLARTL